MDWVVAGLIPTFWASWAAYWLIARRGAKATRQRESVASRAAHIVPLVIGVALFEVSTPFRGTWLAARFLPGVPSEYWTGIAMTAAGLIFTVWARRHLGSNWSGTVTLKQDHELIQSGPYRLVRHPIYTGILFAALGSAIAIGEWRGPLGLVFMTGAFLRKIAVEERVMRQAFGERYARYSAEVPALIPYLY